jgi:hypothetical protein
MSCAKRTYSAFESNELKKDLYESFAKMHLPIPKENEYSFNRLGNLIALDEYGAVIRIEKVDPDGVFVTSDNPFVLQPIGSFNFDKFRIELCPGVPHVGINFKEFELIVKQLNNSGSTSTAGIEDDCGYLPYKTSIFPHGIPVIIDRTDILSFKGLLSSEFNNVSLSPLEEEALKAQQSLYGELKEKFKDMVSSNSSRKATSFWKMMKKLKDNETLSSPWTQSCKEKAQHSNKAFSLSSPEKAEQQAHSLKIAGSNYNHRLKKQTLHSKVLS